MPVKVECLVERHRPMPRIQTTEDGRLEEARQRQKHWKRWGPYLSERQWGTVREDYSPGGTAWEYFPHDHARSRAYRWGEDGLAGVSDNHQRLCFALALWNGRDPILKERLFGVTGNQGNHGEDVKEYYFYLDSTPTHSYMKYLYKYPQRAYPYAALLAENARRDRRRPEYELLDTGVFADNRYFDVVVEYAKATVDDLLIRVAITNRGAEPAEVHVLPTLWFRNTWAWEPGSPRPRLCAGSSRVGWSVVAAEHATLGRRWLVCEGAADLLFTENETNARRLWGATNPTTYVKDAFDDYVVHGRADAVKRWLTGDPGQPPPPRERLNGRNARWTHLYNADIVSMPDKWEYPWYAAWDLAFHTIALAPIDPDFAKSQLILFLREWYMHPNGQIPAYEWAFGDVNPPVHAWAALRVYRIERRCRGTGDREFLAKVFHKLLLNFTWWVNRKDAEGKNVFQGGFLGLDNIGVFDRSTPLPTGDRLEQSDGTSWMGMYCLNMLAIALELARQDAAYEDVASKFFEHFVYIAHAMDNLGDESFSLWNETDGFYYDVLHGDGDPHPMKVRSMVGLIPLFAVETLEPGIVDKLHGFRRRMRWFVDNHPELHDHIETATKPGGGMRRLLAIVGRRQLPRVLRFMLDESEFLSPYGVRAVSQHHRDHPYVLRLDGIEHRVDYEPAESSSGFFGGNSNWRGPVWFPVNYLLIEALQKFHYFYGAGLTVEFPTGSSKQLDLWRVAGELSRPLIRIFLRDGDGRRPVYGGTEKFQRDPHWRDLILFYEYFHGDNGAGIGAGHQTGWTGIVAKLLQQSGER